MDQSVKNQQGQPMGGDIAQTTAPRRNPNMRPNMGSAQNPNGPRPNPAGRPMAYGAPSGMRPMQQGMQPNRQPNRPGAPTGGQGMPRPAYPQNNNAVGGMQGRQPQNTARPMMQQGQAMPNRQGMMNPQLHMQPQPMPQNVAHASMNDSVEAEQVHATEQATMPIAENMQQLNPYVPNFATDFNLPAGIIRTKGVMGIFGGALVAGMLFGAIFFGGGSGATQQNTGLQGVVRNPDITTPMKRCGLIDRGQACVLYIMNTTRYDKRAEDFFDEAVKLTEVQKFSIQMVNPKYAKTLIPPGRFAQIKIPNVR